MTIPSTVINTHILSLFAAAADEEMEPERLLLLMASSIAGSQGCTLDHFTLLTGMPRKGILTHARAMKQDGYLEQYGAEYFLTSRSRDTLSKIQNP